MDGIRTRSVYIEARAEGLKDIGYISHAFSVLDFDPAFQDAMLDVAFEAYDRHGLPSSLSVYFALMGA
jgi:hypothetical protein